MKKTLASIVLTLLTGLQTLAIPPTLYGVNLVAARKSIMFFKFDRELKGANVQVYDWEGKMIAEHTLRKRKLVIDFIDASPGNYTVLVIKENKYRAFHYTQAQTNAMPSPLALMAMSERPDVTFY